MRISEFTERYQKVYLTCVLLEHYGQLEGAGGYLHIVIDDGNVRDCDITACLDHMKDQEVLDIIAIQIANLLLEFSELERDVIICNSDEIKNCFEFNEIERLYKII